MNKKRITILISILIACYLSTSFFVVNEAEYSIVTRFGRTIAVHDDPGLNLKLPIPFERVVRFDKRNMYQIIPEEEFLTSDKKNIIVSSFLTWYIVDPEKFLTSLRTRAAAEARIENLVKSLFGASLGQKPFTDYIPADINQINDIQAAENISAMEQKIFTEASNLVSRDYGINLSSIGVSKFNFPAQNLIVYTPECAQNVNGLPNHIAQKEMLKQQKLLQMPADRVQKLSHLQKQRQKSHVVMVRLKRLVYMRKHLKAKKNFMNFYEPLMFMEV